MAIAIAFVQPIVELGLRLCRPSSATRARRAELQGCRRTRRRDGSSSAFGP